MLLNLHVKNLALIDEIEVDFSEGLNILTGETGAGKSIIIGSILVALGDKAPSGLLREGADYGLAELIFTVDTPAQREGLLALGIEPEDNELIFSRKITAGRSICKLNGETVTAGQLKKAGSLLLDVHGQHEHQSLLNKRKHLEIVDEFGKKEIKEKKSKTAAEFKQYKELQKKLSALDMDEEQRLREISFAQFELEEIDNAGLKVGEDEALEADYRLLKNGRKIMDAASDIHRLTGYDSGEAAGESVGRALKGLTDIAGLDSRLSGLLDQLTDIDALLNDFNRELSDYVSEVDFSEEAFARIESRLDLVNRLKAKYGSTIEEILASREEKEARLQRLLDYEKNKELLIKELDETKERLACVCEKLSESRKKFAARLCEEIADGLRDLNFLNVKFEMEFGRLSDYTKDGFDEAEFLISTNPGEPLRPLSKVASGGELSRIMLAIKTVLAGADDVGTLIFDEIDVGISGRTAQKVSEKMAVIGRSRQVICITHLAQIAAMADCHFVIEKNVEENGTKTSIRALDRKEMVEELARILGGAKITETVEKSAAEMKELAERAKAY